MTLVTEIEHGKEYFERDKIYENFLRGLLSRKLCRHDLLLTLPNQRE